MNWIECVAFRWVVSKEVWIWWNRFARPWAVLCCYFNCFVAVSMCLAQLSNKSPLVCTRTAEGHCHAVLSVYATETNLFSASKGIAVYSLPSTLYPLLSTLYPLLSTLYPLPSTLYPLPSTLYPLPSTLYSLLEWINRKFRQRWPAETAGIPRLVPLSSSNFSSTGTYEQRPLTAKWNSDRMINEA